MSKKVGIGVAALVAVLAGTIIWAVNRPDPDSTADTELARPKTGVANTGLGQAASKPEPPSATGGASIMERALESKPSMLTVGAGASLYAAHCAACHGIDLEGQPDWQTPNPDGSLKAPPHDDSGHTWHHDDKMLLGYTKLGGQAYMAQAGVDEFRSGMPAFENVLSDQEIVQVFDFIKSRWSKRNRKVQRDRSRN